VKRILGFKPEEVLFAPTTQCNLVCRHCGVKRSGRTLPGDAAARFLASCRRLGVQRVGFTGGEPFLAAEFLYSLTRHAVRSGMLFDRVMTNGVWWSSEDDLKAALVRLFNAGFDGSLSVSVDAFHAQDLRKVARFIGLAILIWRRPDIISIACVSGAEDGRTKEMLKALAARLEARLTGFGTTHPSIRGRSIFIKVMKIALSSAGKTEKLKDPWEGSWFKDDYCRGPGNVFYVLPDGDVKPCCGYANDAKELTIGNIKRDSPGAIMKNFRNNRLVATIFSSGLGSIRRRLERAGFVFPGKTGDHCYFCDYILRKAPRKLLSASLMKKSMALAIAFLMIATSCLMAEAQTLVKAKGYHQIKARVIKKLEVPTWYHEGLFYDGKSLWLANGLKGKTWVIDPADGSITSELEPVAGFTEAITSSGDTYYTSEWDEKKLYKIRIENGKMVAESDVSFAPAHPAGLVWNGAHLFIVTWTRGLGTKFNLLMLDQDMKVLNSVRIRTIHEPDHLAWDGKYLWISSWYTKEVYKVDVTTWEMLGYFCSPVSKTTGIAWDGKYFWVTGTYADLYQMEVGE